MKRKLSTILLVVLGSVLFLSGQLAIPGRTYALGAANTVTTWSWGISSSHDMEFSLEPTIDPSPQSVAWAYDFTFVGGKNAEYSMQTSYNGHKALVFTVNGATGCNPAMNAYGGTFSGGDYVALNYAWTVGDTYSMQIKAIGPASSSNTCGASSGAAWGTYIRNTTTGAAASIGEIDVPKSWSGIANSTSEQSQFLGPNLSNCSQIAHASVQFTNLTADAAITPPGSTPPTSHSNSVQSGSCTNSYITDLSNGVQQDIGATPPGGGGGGPPPGGGGGGPPPGGGGGGSSGGSGGTSSGSKKTTPPTGTKTSNTVGSVTVPFSTNSETFNGGSASSVTNINGKKHKSSALQTAATITGAGILAVLLGWFGYLLFTRYIARKGVAVSNLDSDLFLGQAPTKTTLPKPVEHKAAPTHAHKGTKLSKEEYIEFGQEVLLLEELKEQDNVPKDLLDPKDSKPKPK